MVKSFEDLTVWQKCQDLAVAIYKTTKKFPNDEMFAMTNQLRRAVSSISANISEGFGRSSKNDRLHFYTMAYGSLLEVKSFLYLAKRLDYIDESQLRGLLSQCIDCQRLINAFRAGTKRSTSS